MKIPISKKEVARLFNSIDVNKDNKITADEFDTFVKTRHNQIKIVFEKIDRDKNGTISSEELRFSVQSLGYSISNDQLRDLTKKLSCDSSKGDCSGHTITLEKFNDSLLLLPSVNPEGIFESYFNVDDAQSEYTLARDPKSKPKQTMGEAIIQQLYAGGSFN